MNIRSQSSPKMLAAILLTTGLALCMMVPQADAQRRGGGGHAAARTGGGARASAPTSVNRPTQGAYGGGANRAASGNVNRNASQNVNRNANINQNTNINRNTNINSNTNINRDVNVNVDVHDDHWNNWDDHPFATAAAVTAGVAVTSAVIGSIVYSVPPSCTTVIANGVSYTQCGSTWYQPRYSGTTVQYVVVSPP